MRRWPPVYQYVYNAPLAVGGGGGSFAAVVGGVDGGDGEVVGVLAQF